MAGDLRAPRSFSWVKIAAGLTIAAGSTLWVGTHYGFPISTTHVVTGSVMGAGATRGISAVRWGIAGNIAFAWILTLPAAGLVAAALFYPVKWVF